MKENHKSFSPTFQLHKGLLAQPNRKKSHKFEQIRSYAIQKSLFEQLSFVRIIHRV